MDDRAETVATGLILGHNSKLQLFGTSRQGRAVGRRVDVSPTDRSVSTDSRSSCSNNLICRRQNETQEQTSSGLMKPKADLTKKTWKDCEKFSKSKAYSQIVDTIQRCDWA